MKIDPYNHKERYQNWKEIVKDGIPEVGKENSDIIMTYLEDMENGVNISSVSIKGSRSYVRLNTLKEKMIFFAKKFNELYHVNKLTEISEDYLTQFFSKMRRGDILRVDGKTYLSVGDYVKIFKAFWHWHQKVNRKKGIEIPDITLDLDTKVDKPKWVYLTEEQVMKLYDNVKPNYKPLILFLFDSGIRSPTELINIKVSDLYDNCNEVNIRDEISKTFGRRIKLMLCSEVLRRYIQENKLTDDDYLFPIKSFTVNKYLKRVAERLFGNKASPAGRNFSDLTLYDFRHISCCYWLPRYKSESALKYRFGWKQSDKIHYYSELLGMKDTISEEDMLIDVTKTDIEKRLNKSEREKEILTEEVNDLRNQMKLILSYVKRANMNVEYVFEEKKGS